MGRLRKRNLGAESVGNLNGESDAPTFTVGELNQSIHDAVAQSFPGAIWVRGEVQGFDRNRSKTHVFFELVEKEPGSDRPSASIGAVMFAGTRRKVNPALEAAGLEIRDGIEMRFLVRVDFYAPYGRLQLIVESVDLMFSLGEMARRRREILDRLSREGLMERQKLTLTMPLVPLHIGLITSEGSAAASDFLDELRQSGFGFRILLFDTRMQGPETEPSVLRSLRAMSCQSELPDVIVITRGGGSRADLSWFDSEKVARAVATHSIPVITGIGHEIDLSVADEVAYQSFKTPTATAQYLVELAQEFLEELSLVGSRIGANAERVLTAARTLLPSMARGIQVATLSSLDRGKQTLAGAERALPVLARGNLKGAGSEVLSGTQRLRRQVSTRIMTERERLAAAQTGISTRRMRASVGRESLKLENLAGGVSRASGRACDAAIRRLDSWETRARLLDPKNTLKRGYSITHWVKDRKRLPLTDASQVSPGTRIETTLNQGKVTSLVEKREGDESS